MKIVYMNVPGHGHVNPTLPVVAELKRRGHEILYYNAEEFREPIERTGVSFRAYPEFAPTSADMVQAVHNLVNVTLLLLEHSIHMTPYMLNELRRERPDLVIYDSICLWGMQAARILQYPSVASITTFVLEGTANAFPKRHMLYFMLHALPRLPRLIKLRGQLLREHGKGSLPNVLFPCVGDLNLVFTSRDLQPGTPFIDDRFRFVGPSIDPDTRAKGDFPFDRLDADPLIYISLGTIHSDAIAQHDFYHRAFEAFADHHGRFILSIGKGTDVSSLPDIPSNFIVRNHVAQLDLLKHVDVFVTHAGMNSMHEGLYFGVPLVVVPQQMEQFANALQVKRSGTGIVIGDTPPYGRVTASELRAAVDHLLADPSYKQRALSIGESLRNAGGYLRAVDEVEALSLNQIRRDAHYV